MEQVALIPQKRVLSGGKDKCLTGRQLTTEETLLLLNITDGIRRKRQSDGLPALQHIERNLPIVVLGDDPIEDVDAAAHGNLLEGRLSERLQLVIAKVIYQVSIDGRGLHGECLRLGIYHDTVACKDLVPFVLGEIDIGGDDLGIRLRGLRAAGSRLDFRHDDLEIIQRIQLLRRTNLLASTARLVALVVEAVASALELARSHPSIRTLGDKGSPCVSELPAHAPQVEAVLGTWRPAEQAPVGPLIGIRVVGPSDITYTHTIAV